MTGLDKIIDRILTDAKERARGILEAASRDCRAMAQEFAAKAEKIRADAEQDTERGGEAIVSRAKSAAAMERRNLLAATKAALQGFTRTVAKELARKNVRMNCVAPAFVDTEMMRAVGEEKLSASISRTPSQRLCQPEEIAAVVAFLATEDASWVTGQTIFASGGSVCS
jgi:NAD(P)-dependent dehydrogenase (short-subunit alcohol dehydrogenase family)